MPSVSKIDEKMKDWGREWKPEPLVDMEGDVFNILWTTLTHYYGQNHYALHSNYERVLGEMTALASWMSSPPFGNSLIEAISGGEPVSALKWLHNSSDVHAGRKLILSQQAFLLGKLANYMRTCSRAFNPQSREFSNYKNFFQRLHEQFDFGIYNLNYDTVARTARPNAFYGFDRYGNFNPSVVYQRRKWGFLYHLHGSVHHCITNNFNQIKWKDGLNGEFKDRLDPMPDMAQDFRPVPLTTLIAGGFKPDQLLANPYQTFYSSLVRHAQEADAILIAGYGFGDLHVNRVLQNRFEGPDDERPFPQVIILEKSSPNKLQTASIQSYDFWAWQLTHTLNTRFRMSEAHVNREHTVQPFISSNEFETDTLNRVAIWHGGFQEAIPFVDKVTEWLSAKL